MIERLKTKKTIRCLNSVTKSQSFDELSLPEYTIFLALSTQLRYLFPLVIIFTIAKLPAMRLKSASNCI